MLLVSSFWLLVSGFWFPGLGFLFPVSGLPDFRILISVCPLLGFPLLAFGVQSRAFGFLRSVLFVLYSLVGFGFRFSASAFRLPLFCFRLSAFGCRCSGFGFRFNSLGSRLSMQQHLLFCLCRCFSICLAMLAACASDSRNCDRGSGSQSLLSCRRSGCSGKWEIEKGCSCVAEFSRDGSLLKIAFRPSVSSLQVASSFACSVTSLSHSPDFQLPGCYHLHGKNLADHQFDRGGPSTCTARNL